MLLPFCLWVLTNMQIGCILLCCLNWLHGNLFCTKNTVPTTFQVKWLYGGAVWAPTAIRIKWPCWSYMDDCMGPHHHSSEVTAGAACRLLGTVTDSSTPNSQVIEAFSLCMFLFCTFYQTLPSGPPCFGQQGHRLQARHKIRCL